MLFPPEDRSDATSDESTAAVQMIPAATQEQPDQTAADSVMPASNAEVIVIALSLFVASVSLQAVVYKYGLSSCACAVRIIK